MNKKELQNKIEDLEKQLAQVKEQVNSIEFEGIKKSVRQMPEDGEEYFFLNSCGDISLEYWYNHEYDLFRFNTGNCFKTEQEVEDYKENLLTKQALKDLALELNNGVEIDWDDENQVKYYLDYDCSSLDFDTTYSYINLGQVYCLSASFKTIAKERIGEEKLIKLIKSGV